MDELSGVGACDFWSPNTAIGEPFNFVEIGLDVLCNFRAFDEVAVLEGSAGGWVDDRVGKCSRCGLLVVEQTAWLLAGCRWKVPCFRGLGKARGRTYAYLNIIVQKSTCQLAHCAPARPFILGKFSSENLLRALRKLKYSLRT
jgi:hypothetical protein